MKLKFKFNFEQIVAISNLLSKVYEERFNSLTPEEKINASISYDLSDIFERKKKSIIKSNDLFESSKKKEITLKYHEAWALKKICIDKINTLNNKYILFSIQSAINILDEKTVQK